MKLTKTSLLSAIAVVAALAFMTGCEDTDARSSAADAVKKIHELEAKVASSVTKDEMAQRMQQVRDELAAEISARMQKADEKIIKISSELQEKATIEGQQMREAAKNIAGSGQAEYKAQLDGTKAAIDKSVEQIRAELKTSTEDLKKFMDNQLRELYPYAYQPKRMDPNAAPPAETK